LRAHPKKTFPILYFGLILISYLLDACSGTVAVPQAGTPVPSGHSPTISVVAAENFYGDITRQLGAGHVTVVSILSDPNIDPHEYESSVQNAVAVTQTQLVVENGSGYDAWMDKLLSASPNSKRIVLIAANLAVHKLSDNPHFWYSLDNIQTIAQSITTALEKLDSAHSMDYQTALARFRSSLAPIQQKLQSLRSKYYGTSVGLTETIFLYQTEPIGLSVLTPFEFQKAIAEGNDPPADQVIIANDQITSHAIKVLVFNIQTLTPLTANLEDEARQNNIPIVPVSETMPEGKTYQTWMLDQLIQLEQALGG
jgi:zinc/manganese transport system substrate-binding protein